MIEIDRMDLEDVGGNPVKLAKAVLSQIHIGLSPIPVREIAEAVDIYEIREKDGIGFEGALIAPDDKSEGAIVVRGDRLEERKRFTIGHELGHYLNPWHKSDNPEGFRCTAKNLATEWSEQHTRQMKMEAEANQFSAELLMPTEVITQFLRNNRGADLEHVLTLADGFLVSKEAMARRYVEQNNSDPAAVIFSKGDNIRYVKKHPDFPRLNVSYGSIIPSDASFNGRRSVLGDVSGWDESKPGVWVDAKPRLTVYEQTVLQSNDYRITLLTHEFDLPDDFDEDDEIDIEDSWSAKFAYGR